MKRLLVGINLENICKDIYFLLDSTVCCRKQGCESLNLDNVAVVTWCAKLLGPVRLRQYTKDTI